MTDIFEFPLLHDSRIYLALLSKTLLHDRTILLRNYWSDTNWYWPYSAGTIFGWQYSITNPTIAPHGQLEDYFDELRSTIPSNSLNETTSRASCTIKGLSWWKTIPPSIYSTSPWIMHCPKDGRHYFSYCSCSFFCWLAGTLDMQVTC